MMREENFSTPQRQSSAGILLIFSGVLYKLFRMFWALLFYFLLKQPSEIPLAYVSTGFAVVLLGIVLYSYFSYRNFQFHIDYGKEEFILRKGVLSSDLIAIPFDKIQQVNSERGILERIIGVYSLVIDTAGSAAKEVKIKAINRKDAEALSEILLSGKEDKDVAAMESQQEQTKEAYVWEYRLSLATLLKIGLSSNFFRGIGLILAFFSTIFNELNNVFKEEKDMFLEEAGKVALPSGSAFFYASLFLILLLFSILITVAEVFIKYYNLNLKQTKERLLLEMGLRTNTKVGLQPRRVQILGITTNPIQRKLDLYEAKISLASSSRNKKKKSKVTIPGLTGEAAFRVKNFLYNKREEESIASYQPHIVDFFRRINLSLIPLILSLIIPFALPEVTFREWGILSALYFVMISGYNFLSYKALKLEFTEDFLVKSYGVWDKTTQTTELYKLQAISVKRPFWYRRRGLVNLIFHTAGGDISFRAVDEEVLVFMNYSLYKVESSRFSWM
ncbi:PH domain-containing protein [Zunongwangia sp. F363]|uniref:PH domain-containing protein n=1 Tax=Autumnicola tepida TaxID=3075595 RepID=A0ABU3CDG2_9FLAO|nr:PH domain-containing protein [Zunongwangia sp. F363]MDT0644277.1 PH domain-containing protein [Zunongwangia sp. F363]